MLFAGVYVAIAAEQKHEVKILNISFTGPKKPKTEIMKKVNSYTNHFTVSASYKMEVEVDAQVPKNTAFNVRTYATVGGKRVSLGDARIGRAHSSGHVFVSHHIFPNSAKFYGQCQSVCVVDADNEILEKNESPMSNEWKFQATIHPAGSQF
jgi:hypothetical protein